MSVVWYGHSVQPVNVHARMTELPIHLPSAFSCVDSNGPRFADVMWPTTVMGSALKRTVPVNPVEPTRTRRSSSENLDVDGVVMTSSPVGSTDPFTSNDLPAKYPDPQIPEPCGASRNTDHVVSSAIHACDPVQLSIAMLGTHVPA